MDWSAVALSVAEHAGLPALLVSAEGQVLLVAPAAEQALGVRHADAHANWIERYVAPTSRASALRFLDDALAGALRRFEVEVVTAAGSALARFEARPIGRGEQRGLLLLLEQLTPLTRDEPAADYDYEVEGVAAGGLRVLRLWQPGSDAQRPDGKCYAVLHARTTPCEGCPLLSREHGERASVMVHARPPHDYVLTTSRALAGDRASVSVRRVSSAALAALMHARLDELAARARLSKRERSVFGHLMDGRAVADIASDLAISPRTVKFHQANVLQKLGADSRSDLMRLVF